MIIDKQFKELIPKLRDEEFKQLEKNILEEGIRDKLVTWEGILIDGHNRYAIAEKHGVKFETTEKEFKTRDEVINWILDNQLGRRNLTSADRDYLLGMRYKQEKKIEPFKGNQYAKSGGDHFDHHQKTADKIANQYGVGRETVKRAEKFADGVDNISKAKPEMKEEILSGQTDFTKQEISSFSKVEPEKVEEKIEEIKQKKAHVSNNSGNNEWYTPKKYIDFAKTVMGEIDIDPASSEIANKVVNAKKYYTKEDDGLQQEWEGKLWMNPPYAQPLITQFCEKLKEEVESGNVKEFMVLVNNATETAWFQNLASVSNAIWFIKSRVKFVDMDGNPSGAPLQGQCILYYGENIEKFLKVESGFICRCLYER